MRCDQGDDREGNHADPRHRGGTGRAAVAARRIGVAAAFLTFACVLLPGVAGAQGCANPIACENAKAPNSAPGDWEVSGAGDASIQGYAAAMSVNPGESISFKVKTTAAYHIDLYRLGWYGGVGARKLTPSGLVPTARSQPACAIQAGTGLIDCGNWLVSYTWAVPADAVSGVYVAHLVRNDNGGASNIVFVVRDDARHSDVLLSTSDADWQAYNQYGGNSLYACTVSCPPGSSNAYKGAAKVSYNRPFDGAESWDGRSWLQHAELSLIHFLEASGYDVAYTSSLDVNSHGARLLDHHVFISSAQDEYWSAGQRASVEAARDGGVNIAFLSGNEIYWKTRWEPSIAGTVTPNRTLVTYKDTHYDDLAVHDPVTWTGTWQDPRFSPPGDGGRPQNALSGQVFSVNRDPGGANTGDIRVPAEYGKLRLWRNTAAATLAPGTSLKLGSSTLGFEWDEDYDNGFRPAGSFRLSSTTLASVPVFSDYGSVTENRPATHNMTMYRAPSGALVFGAGTVQWAWGLDSDNPGGNVPDTNMRQMTVNLLADMGAQPAALLPGLAAASASSDHTAPSSVLATTPSTVPDGTAITLSGTAADAGGGVVAGIEVTTDNGASWHRAEGTTSWSYSWTAHGNPSIIRTRATDDSGNIETPGAGRQVVALCPCGVLRGLTPAVADDADTNSVELGVRFRSDAAGTVTGVRFYKSAANTGTHTGSLWTEAGNLLARATFTGESASGWQTATFSSPVAITPGTTYVASYFAPNGHYAATPFWFYNAPAPDPRGGATVDSSPLHALHTTGVDGATSNGVFHYENVTSFPTVSYQANNYWVDVVFTTPAPGAVSAVSAVGEGHDAATVSWSAPGAGTPTSYEVTPLIDGVAQQSTIVPGSPPPATTRITGLRPATTYTFTVRAFNGGGAGAESTPSNAVTLLAAPVPDPGGGGPLGPGPGPDPGAGGGPGAGGNPGVVPTPRSAPNTVLASLLGARVVRAKKDGKRTLELRTRLGETVNLAVLATLGKKTVVSRPRTRLFRGDRTVKIVLSRKTGAGKASVRLVFRDGAGAARTVRRTVSIPSLRSKPR